jgi:ferredoxin
MLDRFAIDFALCMYCGICIEVCPFDALFWSPEFEYSEYDIRELTHEKERLREWMYTVPAPPVLDPDGAPAAELVAAEKAEPKVYEAPSLGGAAGVAAPAAPAVAAPVAAAPAAVEAAPAAPAAAKPAREHAEIDKDDVGIDQAVFDAAVAGGMSERQARAKAKSAWMKAWKKANAAPAAAEAAPVAEAAPAAEAEAPAPAAAPEPVDVGEPQIDQEVYDAAIAAGESDRVARAKAKSAWVKKARKAAQQ